jgi:hypothetical protein
MSEIVDLILPETSEEEILSTEYTKEEWMKLFVEAGFSLMSNSVAYCQNYLRFMIWFDTGSNCCRFVIHNVTTFEYISVSEINVNDTQSMICEYNKFREMFNLKAKNE